MKNDEVLQQYADKLRVLCERVTKSDLEIGRWLNKVETHLILLADVSETETGLYEWLEENKIDARYAREKMKAATVADRFNFSPLQAENIGIGRLMLLERALAENVPAHVRARIAASALRGASKQELEKEMKAFRKPGSNLVEVSIRMSSKERDAFYAVLASLNPNRRLAVIALLKQATPRA